MDALLKTLDYLIPILCLLCAALLPAWVKSVVRAELKELFGQVDDHEGRMGAMEQWRNLVASDVRSIPSTNAILTRLEHTINRTDGTLDKINNTLSEWSARLARVEERHSMERSDDLRR